MFFQEKKIPDKQPTPEFFRKIFVMGTSWNGVPTGVPGVRALGGEANVAKASAAAAVAAGVVRGPVAFWGTMLLLALKTMVDIYFIHP